MCDVGGSECFVGLETRRRGTPKIQDFEVRPCDSVVHWKLPQQPSGTFTRFSEYQTALIKQEIFGFKKLPFNNTPVTMAVTSDVDNSKKQRIIFSRVNFFGSVVLN